MSVITTSSQDQQVVPISKLWWVGLVAAAGAAIANLILFLITRGLGIPYIMPLQGPDAALEALPASMVIIASVVPAIGATILFAILGKFLAQPIRVFWIIAAVFLVISFAGPFTFPTAVALSTKIGLTLMHVVAGAAIVGILTTRGREK
jgi:hypothetical protein